MATDIFLSRPTWIEDRFNPGLKGFLGLLQSLELNPRTLGATDYPAAAPLDEVIRLMGDCSGAIILGYPQIMVTAGKIKDQNINNELSLGTEWNHIEAALAHSMDLPLLIIHHINVKRGIFDRGTVGKFIHEIDLSDGSWPLSDSIRGAIDSWKLHLDKERHKSKASEDGSDKDSQLSELHEIEIKILKLLSQGNGVALSSGAIAYNLGENQAKVVYYLERLSNADYIYFPMVIGQETEYELDQNGRKYLIEKNFI